MGGRYSREWSGTGIPAHPCPKGNDDLICAKSLPLNYDQFRNPRPANRSRCKVKSQLCESENKPWKTLHFKTPNVNDKFDSVCSNHLGKAQLTMENYDFVLSGANVRIPKKTTDNVIKSNKCNQCDYASSRAGNLRTHLIKHTGEKSDKCNQCDYATSDRRNFFKHLKTHNGEK